MEQPITSETKEIILNDGSVTIVDAEDYERLNKTKWFMTNMGYVRNRLVGRIHRIIMNAQPGEVVDHIDRDKLNNRKSNLRIVSIGDNSRNRSKSKNTHTQYIGVRIRNKGFEAYSELHHTSARLGVYKSVEAAAHAYNKYVSSLSEYASTNIIENLTTEELDQLLIETLIPNTIKIKDNKNFVSHKSTHKGVYWEHHRQKWRVCVYHNGKKLNFGLYEDLDTAIQKQITEEQKLKSIKSEISK